MSGLAELGRRYARLTDISGLMNAMKSLSLVETRKLARLIPHQRALVDTIETAAGDFLAWQPAAEAPAGEPLLVVVGAERGFCGGFDERVLRALAAAPVGLQQAPIIAVGRRLAARLGSDRNVVARIAGATVTEDVPATLDRLVEVLQAHAGRPGIAVLAHDADGVPVVTPLLPLRVPTRPARDHSRPLLNLAPRDFLAGLLDQFLVAALLGILYASLSAESHQRLAHMDSALSRLDEALQHLRLRRNALRQEQIVEEIEVMLAGGLGNGQRGGRPGRETPGNTGS